MIYGERIRQVRELRGWTQTEVAQRFEVTQPFVAQVENGWSKAPDEFMHKFVFNTGFPLHFFETPPESDFPLGSLLFRARADMTEREQKAIHRHAQMAYEVMRRMVHKEAVRETPVQVPNVPGDPERAATIARSELGLSPDQPVKHVIHTMESAGVLVIALPRAFEKGDAFSVWAFADDHRRRPVVILSAARPADRVRLSLAHELGHLVMHQPLPATPSIHEEADHFAGAFLLPADAMRQEIGSTTTLESFLSLKPKWGVSVQALIVRAHELGLITPRKYRTLFQRLSARGWRMHEPLSSQVPLERPRAVRQTAELIFGRRIDYSKLAAKVAYPESFVRELMDAHASKDPAPKEPVAKQEKPRAERPDLLKFKPKSS
jgi:Zn-dependent peptidase ImmA (M78 family)/transcriptional regulator with XRE-family HTH domain